MKTVKNSFAVEISDIAEYHLHILNYFYQYGKIATLDAFKVKQSTVK